MDSVCYSGINIIFFSFLPIEKKQFSYRLLGIFYMYEFKFRHKYSFLSNDPHMISLVSSCKDNAKALRAINFMNRIHRTVLFISEIAMNK